jgi:hypothetical protein
MAPYISANQIVVVKEGGKCTVVKATTPEQKLEYYIRATCEGFTGSIEIDVFEKQEKMIPPPLPDGNLQVFNGHYHKQRPIAFFPLVQGSDEGSDAGRCIRFRKEEQDKQVEKGDELRDFNQKFVAEVQDFTGQILFIKELRWFTEEIEDVTMATRRTGASIGDVTMATRRTNGSIGDVTMATTM